MNSSVSIDLNIFFVILLLSGFSMLFISLLIYLRLNRDARSFAYVMLAVAVWVIGEGFVMGSSELPEMQFWTRVEYTGISFLPAFWILAIIRLIGNEQWLTVPALILIFLIPTLTWIIVLTDDVHHLYYSDIKLDKTGPLPLMAIERGPWYKVHTLNFYFMLTLGLSLLIAKFRNASQIFRKQGYVVILGTVIPWAINLIYMAGFRPYKYIDPTPYTFVVTGFIIGFGLMRLQLFDVVPVAREKVIEAMQEGLLVLDKQNRIIDANPEMEKILETSVREFIGKAVSDLFGHLPELIDAVKHRENAAFEINLTVGNEVRVYNVTSTSLVEGKKGHTGKVLLFIDVTELHAKEAIRQMMQKKDEFMSIASHELKTPITSMKGYLQIMDKISQKEDNPAYKNFIAKANKQVDKVVSLINDLLDISRIQAGKMEYTFSDFEIGEVINECISFSEYNSPTHIIEIIGDLSLQVKGDKHRIEQVICNLLSNAVKYAPNTNKIILKIDGARGKVKVSVIDFGFGIPKDKQQDLFQKFSRIKNADYQISGLGIGLFLSQEIVSRHGGNIEVESDAGKGSTFSFTLPSGAA